MPHRHCCVPGSPRAHPPGMPGGCARGDALPPTMKTGGDRDGGVRPGDTHMHGWMLPREDQTPDLFIETVLPFLQES